MDSTTVSIIVPLVSISSAVIATGHLVLTKRETNSAIGWLGLIWLSPFLGVFLYALFGINRISRRAQALRGNKPHGIPAGSEPVSLEVLRSALATPGHHIEDLIEIGNRASALPLLAGNRITLLDGGDQAFPAMIKAIESAQRSIALCTYIFYPDELGLRFVEAMSQAKSRGVEVRVLIDDLGARYGMTSVLGRLDAEGIQRETFIPTLAPGWVRYFNLRNHRKILVVDGHIGFTGGMNIDSSYTSINPGIPARQDLHFRLEGPVVASLLQTFNEDWSFSKGERLEGECWNPSLEPRGNVLARGRPDGPDENFDQLYNLFLGAAACARTSLTILTPYFLPSSSLTDGLKLCALRGANVEILVPEVNYHKLIQWAATSTLRTMLESGARIWLTPPPFDHSKLLIVDGQWALVGSANWDPRSFRLNFEFCVECVGEELLSDLRAVIERKRSASKSLTLEQLDQTSLPIRLRDGVARLFSPYI